MSTMPDLHQDDTVAKKTRQKKPVRAEKQTRSRLYLAAPTKDVPPDMDISAIKHEFSRRLQALMIERGWSQSDLARAASPFMANGKFNRDNISLYIRASHLPTEKYLQALLKALKVNRDDLIPKAAIRTGDVDPFPPLAMKPMANGNTWLQINQGVPVDVAMKIIALLGQAGITPKKD